MGRLSRVENERRDDPREQPEAHSDAPPERPYYDEPGPEREPAPESHEARHDFDRTDEPYEQAPPPGEGPFEGQEQGRAPESGPHEQGPGGPGGPGGHGRGRRRGGRGRMSPRDRRMQSRNRGRREQPHRGPYGGGPAPAHGGGAPRAEGEEQRRHSELPPEQRSWILEAKAEVERVQEVLEGVLRDLDHVSEQLTKAEHEKDIAEAEIEQLRESLRRLHR